MFCFHLVTSSFAAWQHASGRLGPVVVAGTHGAAAFQCVCTAADHHCLCQSPLGLWYPRQVVCLASGLWHPRWVVCLAPGRGTRDGWSAWLLVCGFDICLLTQSGASLGKAGVPAPAAALLLTKPSMASWNLIKFPSPP